MSRAQDCIASREFTMDLADAILQQLVNNTKDGRTQHKCLSNNIGLVPQVQRVPLGRITKRTASQSNIDVAYNEGEELYHPIKKAKNTNVNTAIAPANYWPGAIDATVPIPVHALYNFTTHDQTTMNTFLAEPPNQFIEPVQVITANNQVTPPAPATGSNNWVDPTGTGPSPAPSNLSDTSKTNPSTDTSAPTVICKWGPCNAEITRAPDTIRNHFSSIHSLDLSRGGTALIPCQWQGCQARRGERAESNLSALVMADGMFRHLTTCKGHIELEKFECRICGHVATRSLTLKRHEEKQHGIIDTTDNAAGTSTSAAPGGKAAKAKKSTAKTTKAKAGGSRA